MSGIHRAMRKAERDGLVTWTRNDDDRGNGSSAVEAPRNVSRAESPVSLIDPPRQWEVPETAIGDLADSEPLGGGLVDELPFSPLFVVARDPGSIAAEQYRLLRTKLEGRENAGRTQVLVVTSPRIGEGKTTTSANLALTMSQEFQHRVLLLEADLRRPVLAALFGAEPGPGLLDVVTGTATLDEALIMVPGQQLFLLPAGSGASRSTELLASTAMQRTLDMLRSRFDRIVVDTPPMTLADTHVLARLADGLLIVVRSGVTPRPAVERALAAVDRRRLVGIVLNEVEDKPDEYSYAGLYRRRSAE
jgi:capsular exopolysaccharide synthesis family protein